MTSPKRKTAHHATDPDHDDGAFERRGWHVEKKVNPALMLALIAYTVALVWNASAANARLTMLEDVVKEMTRSNAEKGEATQAQLKDINERLVRIETSLNFLIKPQPPQQR